MLAIGVILELIAKWYFTVPVILGLFLLVRYGYGEILPWIFILYMLLFIVFMEDPWKAFLITMGIELAMLLFSALSSKGSGAAYYIPEDDGDETYGPGDPQFDIDNDMDSGSGYGGDGEDNEF